MDAAREICGDGGHTPIWIVADQQTAGRGRMGRHWQSTDGNLFATLALATPCDPSRGPELGFVAGVALYDAVRRYRSDEQRGAQLKWPNDLLIGTAKCAGVLLEGCMIGGRFHVLIGFGVNLAAAPEGLAYPTALVAGEGGRDAFFALLSAAWVENVALWGGGFASIRAAWLERAVLGRVVSIKQPGGDITGTMAGIDGSGRLILETGSGLRLIDAGDVFL